MDVIIFPEKAVGELLPFTINFSDKLQFGEAINGASVAVSVFAGIDANPSAMLSGTVSYTATTVTQNIVGGIPGVIYSIVFIVTATGSHNYVKVGQLAVISNDNPF